MSNYMLDAPLFIFCIISSNYNIIRYGYLSCLYLQRFISILTYYELDFM